MRTLTVDGSFINPYYEHQDPDILWPFIGQVGLHAQCWEEFTPATGLGIPCTGFDIIQAELELNLEEEMLFGKAEWREVTGIVRGYTLYLITEKERLFAWVAFDFPQRVENAIFAVDWTIHFGEAEYSQKQMFYAF